jgi:hypothetical protein
MLHATRGYQGATRSSCLMHPEHRFGSTSTSPCAVTTRLRPHALYVNLVVHREYSSSLYRLQRSTSSSPRVRVPRHVARLVMRLVVLLVVDYSASCRLVVDYFTSAARVGASTRHAAHRSSSTTPPRAGSSSTTSPPPRVRVPRHVAWLVARLVTPLVVDYSGLVVDYFASAARPGASARRVARRATRRRLLHLRRASGCLGTSHGPSRGSSSTTPCAATSSCGHTGSTSATLCVTTTCLAATLALLRVRRTPPRRRLSVASC